MKTSNRAALLSMVVGLVIFGTTLTPAAIAAAPGGGRGGAAPLMTPDQRPDLPPPVSLSAADDHQRLMDLLHVTKIRPGGQSQGVPPEDKANPFGGIENLPDSLTMNDGTKVTKPEQWPARRAEIVEMFDREIYGRVPKDFHPKVTWEVTNTVKNETTITKTLVGHVDMSTYPLIPPVNIQVSLSTPTNAGGPVPVMMQFGAGGGGFGGGGFGGGRGGRGGAPGGGRGAPGASNGAPGAAPVTPGGPGAFLTTDDDQLVFVAAPAGPAAPGAGGGRGFGGAGGARGAGPGGGAGGGAPGWQQQLLAKGWGYASISTNSIQADSGNGLGQGVIGLSLKGQPRKLDDWGVLRAWAWGASRALDYFETDKDVDAKQVGLEGHSRWGKSTIVAMAYDERFAICYCSSSGEGGAKLHRRNYGELVENVAGTSEYYWMAGNFIKYACDPLKWSDMPVDSHELIAMCAPRPCFISGGAPNGDAWVDAKGMFMAAAGSQPVYALLGKKTMGTNEFPPMETPLIDGDIAFRQHSGGHTDVPNWPTFITFASRYLKAPAPKTAATN
ncbi:MAG TPA: acetylxylan esterase [Phycisphaerae bacterium]